MPNNCDTLQLKDDLCKTSNDLVEYVTLTTGTTTNYGLVPLKVEISNQLASYVFPTEVTYNKQAIDDRIKSLVSASGFTTKVKSKDRFTETATPNTLIDSVQDGYFIDGVYYVGGARNAVKPLAPFDPLANDGLETTTTTTKVYNKADIIVCQADDKIYQVIASNTIIGDLLTDTNKFQVLDDVTRHDIVAMSSNGYKTYKGIKHYYDTDIIDGSHDLIASDRGWTKIGNNTYIDEDGIKVFIVDIVPSLNAGAYHPDFNPFGTKAIYGSDDNVFKARSWYLSDAKQLNSVFDSFVYLTQSTTVGTGTITITNSNLDFFGNKVRPDGKFYDKFYTEGENGLLGLGYAYCFDDIIFEEEKNINKSSSFNEYLKTETLTGASSVNWSLAEKAKEIHEVLYSLDSGVTWAVQSFTPDYINNSVILGTARDYILVSYTAYAAPLKADTPIKILEEFSFVLSNNSYDIAKSNLIMNLVSGVVQTGNNITNTELAITKVVDDVFSYTDDSTNTNPTAVYFLGLMSNNEYCIGVYGSANNLIDKSTTYIKRLGVYKK